MKRLPAALAVLGALGVSTLGLSGCNVRFSPYAAVVNGSEISQQQMHDALSAVSANAGYRCTIEAGGSSRVAGAGEGTFNSAFGAQELSILIQDKIVREELVRLRLPEPSGLTPIVRSQVEAAFMPASGCSGSGASVLAAFPDSYRNPLLQFQKDEDALAAHLAGTTLVPGALATLVATHRGELSLACISALIVQSKSEIASLRRRIVHGASFAALARAHSIDTGSAPEGGALGCIPTAEFSSPLDTVVVGLKVDRVSAAISFHSEWLLLLLTGRRPESYVQLVSSLVTKEQTQLGKLITRLIRSARIEVDPQYGTWNTSGSLPRASRPTRGRLRGSCRTLAPTPARRRRPTGDFAAGPRPDNPADERTFAGAPGCCGRRSRSRRSRVHDPSGDERALERSGRVPAHIAAPGGRGVARARQRRRPRRLLREWLELRRGLHLDRHEGPRRRGRARPGRVHGVPGSPDVGERTVEMLRAERSIELEIVPGLSFCELAWARLGIDPVEAAVRLMDAQSFAIQAADDAGPLLVAQCWSRDVLSSVKLSVETDPAAPAVLLHHLGLADESVAEVPWSEIDRTLEADHLTSLYIPQLEAPIAQEVMRFVELVRVLRERCPWDRAQTHASLVRHLLEETYEAIEAIESLGEDPTAAQPAVVAHVAEELGDLLCQVLFHTTLAEEEGLFGLGEVARGVHDKLVSRHPHVFGDVSATTPGAVLANWERIKQTEKRRTHLFEGVPAAMPALARAAKAERKLASVGLGWPTTGPDAKALVVALEGVLTPADSDRALDRQTAAAAGTLLCELARLVAHRGADPESLARQALDRLGTTVADVESAAGGAGVDLGAIDPARRLDLWRSAVEPGLAPSEGVTLLTSRTPFTGDTIQ